MNERAAWPGCKEDEIETYQADNPDKPPPTTMTFAFDIVTTILCLFLLLILSLYSSLISLSVRCRLDYMYSNRKIDIDQKDGKRKTAAMLDPLYPLGSLVPA